jgi:hypothetical protein
MRPDLELRLWNAIHVLGEPRERTARAEIQAMLADGSITNPKQAWRTLQKWTYAGLYDYGVAIDLGWRIE